MYLKRHAFSAKQNKKPYLSCPIVYTFLGSKEITKVAMQQISVVLCANAGKRSYFERTFVQGPWPQKEVRSRHILRRRWKVHQDFLPYSQSVFWLLNESTNSRL